MEDLTALRDYDLKPDELNIIDLSVGMRGAAAPSNVPHMPLPPEAPPPSGKTSDLSSSITTEERTSSSEDAASPSELDLTTTRISFCGRILDEYSSSALEPELSEVVKALAQLSALASQRAQMSQQQEMRAPTVQVLNAPLQPTPPPMELGGGAGQGEPEPAPQRVQLPQRQVMWAPKDQIIKTPLQPTPPHMELENGAGLEDPAELTQPPTGLGEPQTETMVPVPHAHEPPPQGASFDTPTQQISTFTVTYCTQWIRARPQFYPVPGHHHRLPKTGNSNGDRRLHQPASPLFPGKRDARFRDTKGPQSYTKQQH